MERRKLSLKDKELEGLKSMKEMIQEYLGSGDGTKAVREYISNAYENETLLLQYLKGRKFRPKHAWETLKRYAEVRFDLYPEVFVSSCPPEGKEMITVLHAGGLLKARDSKGRRIAYFDAGKWNPDKISFEVLTMICIHMAEQIMNDEDCMNNGFIFIQECAGMNLKHAKEYSLNNMMRFMNVFWFACPLRPKAVIFTNVPIFLTFLHGIIKPFLPKKLKDRFNVNSTWKKFEPLHEIYSPDILPKSLGGTLDPEEANDLEVMSTLG